MRAPRLTVDLYDRIGRVPGAVRRLTRKLDDSSAELDAVFPLLVRIDDTGRQTKRRINREHLVRLSSAERRVLDELVERRLVRDEGGLELTHDILLREWPTLRDWITLATVDDRQQVDKLIEVAMPSPRGDLGEHLLLVRGSFNGRHILQAAAGNGGTPDSYAGVKIVIVKPFAREQKEMTDTRWLAVLNDTTSIFGTPVVVKNALDRYLASAAADGALMRRLLSLKPDVNCWSVLSMPGAVLARHLRAGVRADGTACTRHDGTARRHRCRCNTAGDRAV